MIIVHLMGGLGNQLFQYATARRLAHKNRTELLFDIESYKKDRLREFSLTPFNIEGEAASENTIARMKAGDAYLKYFPVIRRFFPARMKRVLRSPSFEVNTKVLKGGKNHYLYGYWAHELYFMEIRDVLLKELTLKSAYKTEAYQTAKAKLESENSVSIHIRRGDYAKSSDIQSLFGLMPLSYYEKAIENLQNRVDCPVFYIFTDDTEWVKQNFKPTVNLNFIGDIGSFEDFQELRLMSYCKHNIMANSTFSWWGAWLNSNPGKIVIAPQKWYNDALAQKFYEQNEFVPKDWTKL